MARIDSRLAQRWWRHAMVAAAAAATVATASGATGAEQKPTVPAAAAPGGKATATEVSIDGAKRQLDLLKSAGDGSGQPKAGLPRIAMPELHSAPTEPAPRPTTGPTRPEAEGKTGNWLVDAMEKARDEKIERERKERGLRPSDEREKADRALTGEPQKSADSEPPVEKKEEIAGVNPLAPYLAQWMSAPDYALLGTTILRTAEGGESPIRPGTAGIPGGSLSGGAGVAADIGSLAGPAKPVSAPVRMENPYLQLLNAPSTSTALAPPPVAPAMSPPPSAPPVFSPAPVAAPAKPRVPDFIKAPADEKYFKQLKRF